MVSAAALLLAVSPAVSRGDDPDFRWSGQVRETFISLYEFRFGSDNMAWVKREMFDQGFTSVTAVVRLAMRSREDSLVYAPAMRSMVSDYETLVARVNHGFGRTVLKPVIGLDPEKGVLRRLTGIRPRDARLWFASYGQALAPYVAVAAKRNVDELVAGTGLGGLWSAPNGGHWISILRDLRRRMAGRVKLSVEISSVSDLAALESWQKSEGASFDTFGRLLDRIRVSASPLETVRGDGRWDAAATRVTLESLLERVERLFPDKPVTFANITVPACRERSHDEDEVACAPGQDPDQAYQAQGLRTWFEAVGGLSPRWKAKVDELEFLESTTEPEPDKADIDPRFLFYNAGAREVFRAKKKPVPSAQPPRTNRAPATEGAFLAPAAGRKTACIYFDQTGPSDFVGPIHARMLANLIGGFRRWRAEIRQSSEYRKNDFASCEAAFYLASNYFFAPPAPFYDDAAAFAARRQLVWMNYRFREFAQRFTAAPLGFEVTKIIQPDAPPSPENEDPGFFRYFEYKGETFEKLARWNHLTNRYSSSPELNLVTVKRSDTRVLATARHSKRPERTPYAVAQKLRSGGIWYVADLPFSFVHYEDRYFILCDLLWDVLEETPPSGPRVALVRLEDVNPAQGRVALRWAVDYLADRGTPFSLAVIPYYSSVFKYGGERGADPEYKPVDEFPDFVGGLRYAKARGAQFVFHGVAHQAGDLVSGYDGVSAADYEFWQYPENTPVAHDSPEFVVNLLEKGEAVFRKLGIRPLAWEVPHYAASAADFILFGKLFEWNYHRAIYFNFHVDRDAALDSRHRFFDCVSPECRRERFEMARGLAVTADHSQFGGQVLPYPIWEDSYGQALIPETLGMIDYPFYNDATWRPVARPSDILRRAKKLLVVRGAYASFFWHPDLLNRQLRYYQRHPEEYERDGGKNSLIRTVEGLEKLGYVFRSIADCDLFPRAACATSARKSF